MRYLAYAMIGASIGVLFMLISTFIQQNDRAAKITEDCAKTEFFAVSSGREMRVYDCSGQTKDDSKGG